MNMVGRQFLFSIWLPLLSMVVNGLDHSPMFCSYDNAPVCAQGHGEYLLFKNECDLRKAQNENLIGGPLYDVSLQYCLPACDLQCEKGYRPVCGVSVTTAERRTFRNRCEMTRTSCLTKSDWLVYKWDICPAKKNEIAQHTVLVGERKRSRPVPCTNIYRPVCASYAGVKSTFSNECLVNAENIRTQRNWRIVSEGLCGEDSTKMKHNRKYKPKAKPKQNSDRMKRSHKKTSQVEDFKIAEDAVEIFAPSTFHTQFISNTGSMVKSYSLPARKPYFVSKPKIKIQSQAKNCVFSNEPVCGSFNTETRTFPNVCALMEYSQNVGNAWTILYEGSCRRCDAPCPNIYSPICANRNGINYTIINKCYLERVRCKDPNSSWKITKNAECDEISKGLSTERSRQTSLIPKVLYTSENNKTNALIKPMIRSRKLTTTTTTTAAPKSAYTLKRRKFPLEDINNRKIRKIDLTSFEGNNNFMPDQSTEEKKLWSSSDNWLIQQTLDNVKNMFNKKPSRFTKSQNEKESWVINPITNMELTTITPKMMTKSDINMEIAKLLNINNINAQVDTKMLYMIPDRSTPTVTTTTTTATTKAPIGILPPPTTTTRRAVTTTTSYPVHSITTIAPTSTTAEATSKITAPEEATSAPGIVSTTTKAMPVTKKGGGLEDATTRAASNDDYMSEEQVTSKGRQTSIYGLDKNSLIMRLLRARSSQNVLL